MTSFTTSPRSERRPRSLDLTPKSCISYFAREAGAEWRQLFLRFVACSLVALNSACNESPEPTPPPAIPPSAAELGTGPQWTAEQKDAQRAAAAKVLENLAATLQRGEKQFVIPPGDYRFDEKLGKGIELEGVDGLTIEATGATFWSDRHRGVRFKNCKNITLNGLTLDSDPLPWIQGTITALDPAAKTIDFKIEPGFQEPDAKELEIHRRVLFFDRATSLQLRNGDLFVDSIQPLGNGVWRLAKFSRDAAFMPDTYPRPIQIGDRFAVKDWGTRRGNFHQENCERITLSNVVVYGTTGFVFSEINGLGANRYLRCKIVRRPGTNRLLACAADGLHSYNMDRGPLIEDCEFSFAADDLIAIHGFFPLVVESTNDTSCVIAGILGTRSVVAGSKIQFYRPPYGDYVTEAVITSLEPIQDPTTIKRAQQIPEMFAEKKIMMRDAGVPDVVRLVLDRPIQVERGDVIFSSHFCGAGAVVRNCHIHDGHVNGLIIKSNDFTAENNRIERTGLAAIGIISSVYWLEGPFFRNIKITGNTLVDNSINWEKGGAAIWAESLFCPSPLDLVFSRGQQNENLQILNNTIVRPGSFAIRVANTRGVTIEGNRIDSPFAVISDPASLDFSKKLGPGGSAPSDKELDTLRSAFYPILLLESSSFTIKDNTISNPPAGMRGEIGWGPGAVAGDGVEADTLP